jgi:hypothetical protein
LSRRARTLGARNHPWTSLDPERRNAILLIGGVSVIIAFALALVAYGYYNERIAPKHATMLKVGSRAFDYSFIERRARADALRGLANPSNITQAALNAVTTIGQEEIIRRVAESQGVAPSEAEVEAQIKLALRLPEDVSRDVFAARYREELLRLGLPPAEYREIVVAQLGEERLRQDLAAAVPARTMFVNLRLIQVATRDEAEKAKSEIEQDTSDELNTVFARKAIEVSTHPSKVEGGEMRWLPRGALPKEIEDVAYNITGLSDVIETANGAFLLYVRRTEERDVTDDDREKVVEQQFADLLQRTRDVLGVQALSTAKQLQRLALAIRDALVNQ